MKIKLNIRLILATMGIALFATVITAVSCLDTSNKEITKVFQAATQNASIFLEQLFESKYPGDWNVTDGELHKGEVHLADHTFVNEIYKETGYYVTLCVGNTSVITNETDFSIDATIGTKVLAGETVIESTIIKEKEIMACYKPLQDKTGNTIGILAIGVDEALKKESTQKIIHISRNMSRIALFLSFLLSFAMARRITKPIGRVKDQLIQMSENDFTLTEGMKQRFARTEIGEIADAAIVLCASVGNMVRIIQEESNTIDLAANDTNTNLLQLSENVDEVSASTEEISAGMEEASAGTEQVLTIAGGMAEQLQTIANNVSEGERRAAEIFTRANEIKEEAIKARSDAHDIMEVGRLKMDEAIKQSEKIAMIKELTDTITAIAGKTKLLSLNASIEATRAGDAGLGFAVVANEIRDLSEASQEAVNSIREVVELVLRAVTELVEVSKETVEGLGDNAGLAYERLVKTGETYQDDSLFMSNFLEEIQQTFEEVNAEITGMTDAMEQMSDVVTEGAQGTTVIAEHSTEIVGEVSKILALSDKTKESSATLKDYVKEFKYE